MQTPLRVRLLCPGRRKVFLAAACAVVIIASLSACSPLVLFSCVRLTSTAPQLRSRQPSATLLRSTASADVVDQVAVESNSDTGPSQEEISKKLKELEDLAEQGDIRAQFKLGKAFAEGKYVPQDLTRAFELLSSAADEGHNKARYLAGMMILNGEASYNGNSEEDVELALAYLTFSAEEGHIESQFHLSMMHFSGVGMDEEDNVGGFYWMKQAADRGHAEAQYHLGSMLFKGGSLNQNKTWAADYYRKSARQGFAKGQEALGLALLSGLHSDGSRKRPTRGAPVLVTPLGRSTAEVTGSQRTQRLQSSGSNALAT